MLPVVTLVGFDVSAAYVATPVVDANVTLAAVAKIVVPFRFTSIIVFVVPVPPLVHRAKMLLITPEKGTLAIAAFTVAESV
jgi:hypothetical protein